jgi:hypothetical protein
MHYSGLTIYDSHISAKNNPLKTPELMNNSEIMIWFPKNEEKQMLLR